MDRNNCCRVRGAESSRMVSSEQLRGRGFVVPTVLRLWQLPPNWPSPPFSAAARDRSLPPITSLIGESVSSHVPCLSSDRRRHSVERNDALVGGGTEGRSGFLRFPRWCLGGVGTYPQSSDAGTVRGQRAGGETERGQREDREQGGGQRGDRGPG